MPCTTSHLTLLLIHLLSVKTCHEILLAKLLYHFHYTVLLYVIHNSWFIGILKGRILFKLIVRFQREQCEIDSYGLILQILSLNYHKQAGYLYIYIERVQFNQLKHKWQKDLSCFLHIQSYMSLLTYVFILN